MSEALTEAAAAVATCPRCAEVESAACTFADALQQTEADLRAELLQAQRERDEAREDLEFHRKVRAAQASTIRTVTAERDRMAKVGRAALHVLSPLVGMVRLRGYFTSDVHADAAKALDDLAKALHTTAVEELERARTERDEETAKAAKEQDRALKAIAERDAIAEKVRHLLAIVEADPSRSCDGALISGVFRDLALDLGALK